MKNKIFLFVMLMLLMLILRNKKEASAAAASGQQNFGWRDVYAGIFDYTEPEPEIPDEDKESGIDNFTLNISSGPGSADGEDGLYYYFNGKQYTFTRHKDNPRGKPASSSEYEQNALMTVTVPRADCKPFILPEGGHMDGAGGGDNFFNTLRMSYIKALKSDGTIMKDTWYYIEKAEFIIRTLDSKEWKVPRQYNTTTADHSEYLTNNNVKLYKTTTVTFTPGAINTTNSEGGGNNNGKTLVIKYSLRNEMRMRDFDRANPYYFTGLMEFDINIIDANSQRYVFADIQIFKGGEESKSYCIGDMDKNSQWLRQAMSDDFDLDFENITTNSGLSARQYSEWEVDGKCTALNSKNSKLKNGMDIPCPNSIYSEWVSANKANETAIMRCYYEADANIIIGLEGKMTGTNVNGDELNNILVDKYCAIPGNSFNIITASGQTCDARSQNEHALAQSCEQDDNIVPNWLTCKNMKTEDLTRIMTAYCLKNDNRKTEEICACYNISQGNPKTFCDENKTAPGCDIYNANVQGARDAGHDSLAILLAESSPACGTISCRKENEIWQPAGVDTVLAACPSINMCIQKLSAGSDWDSPEVEQSCNISTGEPPAPEITEAAAAGAGAEIGAAYNAALDAGATPEEAAAAAAVVKKEKEKKEKEKKKKLFIGIGIGVGLCVIIIIIIMMMMGGKNKKN